MHIGEMAAQAMLTNWNINAKSIDLHSVIVNLTNFIMETGCNSSAPFCSLRPALNICNVKFSMTDLLAPTDSLASPPEGAALSSLYNFGCNI